MRMKRQKSTSWVLFFATFGEQLYASHKTGLERSSAYIYALRLSVYKDAHFLYVNTPFAASSAHGVGASVSSFTRFASYKAATCH
jgi:hypothetical protein